MPLEKSYVVTADLEAALFRETLVPISWKLALLTVMFGFAGLEQAKMQSLFLILIMSQSAWMINCKAMRVS